MKKVNCSQTVKSCGGLSTVVQVDDKVPFLTLPLACLKISASKGVRGRGGVGWGSGDWEGGQWGGAFAPVPPCIRACPLGSRERPFSERRRHYDQDASHCIGESRRPKARRPLAQKGALTLKMAPLHFRRRLQDLRGAPPILAKGTDPPPSPWILPCVYARS